MVRRWFRWGPPQLDLCDRPLMQMLLDDAGDFALEWLVTLGYAMLMEERFRSILRLCQMFVGRWVWVVVSVKFKVYLSILTDFSSTSRVSSCGLIGDRLIPCLHVVALESWTAASIPSNSHMVLLYRHYPHHSAILLLDRIVGDITCLMFSEAQWF